MILLDAETFNKLQLKAGLGTVDVKEADKSTPVGEDGNPVMWHSLSGLVAESLKYGAEGKRMNDALAVDASPYRYGLKGTVTYAPPKSRDDRAKRFTGLSSGLRRELPEFHKALTLLDVRFSLGSLTEEEAKNELIGLIENTEGIMIQEDSSGQEEGDN